MDTIIKNIPRWPIADEKEEMAVKKVLTSTNWWRNAGIQTKKFEKDFARFQGAAYGITVANGTQAIEIALKALGISEGDEVIVPDFTFYSTVSAVLAVKAVPVLVDVKEDTFCIDPEMIEAAISPRTKAIIVVHMAGNIADMERINEIACKNGLPVVEDAAHAHGAFWKNQGAGSLGTLGTFSFQNAKLMTAGEGGAIISNDEEVLRRAFLESNCGREEGDTCYNHIRIGTNARLSEVQGAILEVQLSRLSEQVALREQNYKYLVECLKGIPGITLQKIDERVTVNPHYMVMFYYDKNVFGGADRSSMIQYLKEAGIPCNRSFEAIHKLPVFRELSCNQWRLHRGKNEREGCMVSERISKDVICLPHNILLGDKNLVEMIVEIIKNFNK